MPAKNAKQRAAIAIAEKSRDRMPTAPMVTPAGAMMSDFASKVAAGVPAPAPNTQPATPTVPKRGEPVPGLMATRNNLRGIRQASVAHIKRGSK
jgi:hypothetical protein